MPQTKLQRTDGKQISHTGTSAVTLTLIRWTPEDSDAHIEIEWEVASKEELLTISTDFLKWMDQIGGGIVENAIANFAKETGRLKDGAIHLKYKSKPQGE